MDNRTLNVMAKILQPLLYFLISLVALMSLANGLNVVVPTMPFKRHITQSDQSFPSSSPPTTITTTTPTSIIPAPLSQIYNGTALVKHNLTELISSPNYHHHHNHSTNANKFSSKISTLLKILQIVNNVASNMTISSMKNTNSSHSESRSVSSWLGLKKPSTTASTPTQRRVNINSNQAQQQQFHFPPVQTINNNDLLMNFMNPKPQPFIPITPPTTFMNPYEPVKLSGQTNPFVYFPSLGDTDAIDYWLKFLEDPKIEEQIMPILTWGKKQDFIDRPSYDFPKKLKKATSRNSERRPNKKKVFNDFKNDYDDHLNNDWPTTMNNDVLHDLEATRSKKVSKQVANTEYNSSPRCDKFTEDICIDDFEYPEYAILDEIYKRKDIFQLMYAEVNGDVPLVDGIPKDMDESFSQDYYYSNNDNSESDDYDGYTPGNAPNRFNNNKTYTDYDKGESNQSNISSNNNNNNKNDVQGYVCRSEVLYAKPKLAKNLKKKWRVIVNAGDFTQTIRLEKCNKANSECRFISGQKYASRCAQVNSIHRLLVFEKGKGFYIDSFRIPTACTCHVYSVKQATTNSDESSLNVKRIKNKPQTDGGDDFDNPTLWSLIAGSNAGHNAFGNDNGNQNQNNQNKLSFLVSDQHQPQQQQKRLQQQAAISLLNNNDLIKLLPHLTQIESDNVFQRLLEGLSNDQHQQQQFNNNNNNFKNSLIQPEYQLSLAEKLSNGNGNSNNNNNPLHHGQSSTTEMLSEQPLTSIVTPSRNIHQQPPSAPVVQVIHMPVSTGLVSMDQLEPGINSKLQTMTWPAFRMDHNANDRSTVVYSKYLASASNNYSHSQIKPNSSLVDTASSITSDRMPTRDSMITISGNQTTKTVILPKQQNEQNKNKESLHDDDDDHDDDDHDDDQDDDHEEKHLHKEIKKKITDNKTASSDKKINFSYHPILDYIVN